VTVWLLFLLCGAHPIRPRANHHGYSSRHSTAVTVRRARQIVRAGGDPSLPFLLPSPHRGVGAGHSLRSFCKAPAVKSLQPRTRDGRLGHRLGCLPDAQLPTTEPRAGGHRWLPNIQPPTLDGSAGVGGHPRADLVDHQPRPQGHHPGIDRDGLPGAGPARGRDPLARMAAHLEDAKLNPAGAFRARRRARGGRPGRIWRRGRGWVRGTAGHQEHSTSDRAEQRNGWRPQAASVSSADRHVMALLQRVSGAYSLASQGQMQTMASAV
jgi:hypothetical protein